jgi:chemotaxis protein MotB
MRRRKAAEHASHERWLVSYADFITLLFAFFVVLYASAQVDKHKAAKLADAIQEGFQDLGSFSRTNQNGGAAPSREHSRSVRTTDEQTIQRLRSELESLLGGEIARGQISIYEGPEGLVLSLRETGFFDSGSAQVRSEAMERFGRIANILGEAPYRIRVEGHTDNLPIHNSRFASNWELSTARSTEMVRLLVTQFGFDPAHLAAAGYAEFHPRGDNTTEAGRQANRRVDIVVLTTAAPQEKRP